MGAKVEGRQKWASGQGPGARGQGQGGGQGGRRQGSGGAGAGPTLTNLPEELDPDALVFQPLLGVLERQAHLRDTVFQSQKRKYLSFFPSSVLCSARFLLFASFRRKSTSTLCVEPQKLTSPPSAHQWKGGRAARGADARANPAAQSRREAPPAGSCGGDPPASRPARSSARRFGRSAGRAGLPLFCIFLIKTFLSSSLG